MTVEVLGISLGILGMVWGIICLMLSIRHIKHRAGQLSASLLIVFILSRIFFDVGLAFHLDFMSTQT
jgi:hypothetical protein